MRRKCKKTRKKTKRCAPKGGSAECAVPAGGKEGSKPSGVCETFCTTLHAIFLHAKKMLKVQKKLKLGAPRRNARGQREVRRVQNPPGFARPSAKLCMRPVCMRRNMRWRLCKSLCKSIAIHLARRAGVRRIVYASRIPPRPHEA